MREDNSVIPRESGGGTRGETRRSACLVVVGGGLGGATVIRNLPSPLRRPGATLLIDRNDSYTFAPLLHEVAVGRIHPDSVVSDVSALCRSRCDYLRCEVTDLSPETKTLATTSGPVRYEHLVLATGSRAARPPADLVPHLQTFHTLDDALRLRSDLNDAWWAALEAGRRGDPIPGALTVVIVGGGATGVELSAEVAVLFDYLRQRSRREPAVSPRIVLIEATDRLMGWLDPYFHDVAVRRLSHLGVEVRLGTPVEEATPDSVRVGEEYLPAATKLWTAGVEAVSPAADHGIESDASGRLRVGEYLTLPGHPEIYMLGDAGLYKDPGLGSLPPTGSLAVQQGAWVARDLDRRLRGGKRRPPFRFSDRGYAVSLGPESAVAEVLGRKLEGPAAQALYRSVLLYFLKSRRDRVLTGADWAMERTIGRLGFERPAGQRSRLVPAPGADPRSPSPRQR
ncbi:MAG TPA: FAD-dependent oxidoreductase [Rubrobacteraceae bacterium]|nr:FAD-dependent oxidoreductase [Rubrobacteraceae bacterium]